MELPDRGPRGACRVIRTQWSPVDGAPRVELYRVQGGGHAIPGRKQYLPKAMIGTACQDIDGPRVIWRFFQAASA